MRITLCQILEPERHVLFGEWLFAKHSKHYTSLPAYFIAFDIYDKVRGRGETEMVGGETSTTKHGLGSIKGAVVLRITVVV